VRGAKRDRMFRSTLDALDVLADLKKRSIALHMVDLGGDVPHRAAPVSDKTLYITAWTRGR
jgi:hypothetical protein